MALTEHEMNAGLIAHMQSLPVPMRSEICSPIYLAPVGLCPTCDGAGMHRNNVCGYCGGRGVVLPDPEAKNRGNKIHA